MKCPLARPSRAEVSRPFVARSRLQSPACLEHRFGQRRLVETSAHLLLERVKARHLDRLRKPRLVELGDRFGQFRVIRPCPLVDGAEINGIIERRESLGTGRPYLEERLLDTVQVQQETTHAASDGASADIRQVAFCL
jgi:hypothetical protein